MCGISGIWEFNGQIDHHALDRFTRSLSHRGPVGQGSHVDPRGDLALGHRRLAILDLSEAGGQPMSYANGRFWLTYNGEIYNFLEVRDELEAVGYRFRSDTDSEVILAAYEEWGHECQFRFNGMWAFAIWDSLKRSLFLSRDRFGIKPMYFTAGPHRFAFASELKAFLHLDGFRAQEDTRALAMMIARPLGLEATERTLLSGVRRLPAGHCMTIADDGHVRMSRWWSTLDHLVDPPRDAREQAEGFRDLFQDACRLRLRSDVDVGTCLSGGLDSSSVLCTVAELATSGRPTRRSTPDWHRAFVATFPGTPLDERRFAEAVIAQTDAEARFVASDPDTLTDVLDQVVYDFEEPYLTLPFPIWDIYSAVRHDGIIVTLDGHGADEMLGGYHFQLERALVDGGGVLKAPLRSLDLLRTLRRMNTAQEVVGHSQYLRLAFAGNPVLRSAVRGVKRSLRASPGVENDEQPSWLTRTPISPSELTSPCDDDDLSRLGPLTAGLYRDFHTGILPMILRNYDRCSMAHGVEVRMPFLDWRLVTYVFSLSDEMKVGGGYTKRVLRDGLGDVLPEQIRTRAGKIGFNSPLPNWFEGPLSRWLDDIVREPAFADSDLWDAPAIQRFVGERATGGWGWEDAMVVWPYIHAHRWREAFLGRAG